MMFDNRKIPIGAILLVTLVVLCVALALAGGLWLVKQAMLPPATEIVIQPTLVPTTTSAPAATSTPVATPTPTVPPRITAANVAGMEIVRILKGHSAWVSSVAFSPDGTMLASGAADGVIKLWNLTAERGARTLAGHTDQVLSVAFSPDGRMLASTASNEIRLWNVASGQTAYTLTGHVDLVPSVAFSPDGTRLASGSFDTTIKLWNVANGQEMYTFTGHTAEVLSIAFSPDGAILSSGSWDRTVRLWEAASGREMITLPWRTEWVRDMAFSPDGKLLALGLWNGGIKLWDVPNGREQHTLTGHTVWARSVAFSPGGAVLASASADKTVKLWDVASGRELRTLNGHTDWVNAVAFSPDGTVLASGSSDGTIRLWGLEAMPLAPRPVLYGEWPMFMHNAVRNGFSAETLTLPVQLAWTFKTAGPIRMSSAAVSNNTVYIGSEDGYLYAIDAVTGDEIWRFRTREAVISSPAIARGMVFVGSRDRYLYAVDSVTGEERWRFLTGMGLNSQTGDGVDSSPVVISDTVYFGSNDGAIYAVNANTGEQRWVFRTRARVFSSPAYTNTVLYADSDDHYLYALDAVNGPRNNQPLWRYDAGASIGASPAVADGKVYIGDLAGWIHAVDAATGRLVWKQNTQVKEIAADQRWILAPLAIAGDRVYVASFNHVLYAFDKESGIELARFTADDVLSASPIVVGDLLLIGSYSGRFYILDAKDLEEKQPVLLLGAGISSSAIAVDGTVFVGCEDGKLYAFRYSDLTHALTDTPVPTPHPAGTSTRTLTHTAKPHCPMMSKPFADIGQSTQDKLGCALDDAHVTWMAQEFFEQGVDSECACGPASSPTTPSEAWGTHSADIQKFAMAWETRRQPMWALMAQHKTLSKVSPYN